MSMSEPSWVPESDHAETLIENWLFQIRRERFRSRAEGKTHDFYVMRLADAVNVVAVTPRREVILVRQFRAGSALDSLETPGGLLDPGEDPLTAAARELKEETGYAGSPARLLGTVWSNPSIMTSRTSFVLIADARKVADPKLDPSEEVSVERVPADRIHELIRSGAIGHSLAVLSLFYWLEWERRESLGEA